jgi:hypothetical protein
MLIKVSPTIYSLVFNMQEHWNGQPHVVAYTDATLLPDEQGNASQIAGLGVSISHS